MGRIKVRSARAITLSLLLGLSLVGLSLMLARPHRVATKSAVEVNGGQQETSGVRRDSSPQLSGEKARQYLV